MLPVPCPRPAESPDTPGTGEAHFLIEGRIFLRHDDPKILLNGRRHSKRASVQGQIEHLVAVTSVKEEEMAGSGLHHDRMRKKNRTSITSARDSRTPSQVSRLPGKGFDQTRTATANQCPRLRIPDQMLEGDTRFRSGEVDCGRPQNRRRREKGGQMTSPDEPPVPRIDREDISGETGHPENPAGLYHARIKIFGRSDLFPRKTLPGIPPCPTRFVQEIFFRKKKRRVPGGAAPFFVPGLRGKVFRRFRRPVVLFPLHRRKRAGESDRRGFPVRCYGQAQAGKDGCTGYPSPKFVNGAHTPPLLRRKRHLAFEETPFLKSGHKIFSAGQDRNFSCPVTGVLCERHLLKLP
jgi:hypothetical protein